LIRELGVPRRLLLLAPNSGGGWIGVLWSPAESVTRRPGHDLATQEHDVGAVARAEGGTFPLLRRLPAKLTTSHPARRRTGKVFRNLNNFEQVSTSAAHRAVAEEVTGVRTQ
jgi:hypothetical protein